MRNTVQAVLIPPHAACTSAESSAKPQTCLSKRMQMRELVRVDIDPMVYVFFI